MAKLITNPTVKVIAATTMAAQLLGEWAEENELAEVTRKEGTPLNRIHEDLINGRESHLDLLSEFSGRHCYRSWERGRGLEAYFNNILDGGHGSVLEHSTVSLAISGVSRALTHELIRHRAGFAVSQESQRYVNAQDINFVVPPLLLHIAGGNLESPYVVDWHIRQNNALDAYLCDMALYDDCLESLGYDGRMRKKRAAEAARASLPNAAETRLVWTGNMRALRHFCELRGDEHADLEIRRLAATVTEIMKKEAPITFRDFEINHDHDLGVATTSAEVRKV